jgi:hypothetical protein
VLDALKSQRDFNSSPEVAKVLCNRGSMTPPGVS